MLITRPKSQNQSLADKLESLGAQVHVHPVVEIDDSSNREAVLGTLGHLSQYSAIAFLSRHAVTYFAQAFSSVNKGQVSLPPIAAIGSGTAAQLQAELGLEADFLPEESNSQSMAELLILTSNKEAWDRPILILRADRGSEVLPQALASAKVRFQELAIYQSRDIQAADDHVWAALKSGEIDWVTVTSSAIARNTARIFDGCLSDVKLVSISPQTSAAAIDAGLRVDAEAKEYNLDGIVQAIVDHCERLS